MSYSRRRALYKARIFNLNNSRSIQSIHWFYVTKLRVYHSTIILLMSYGNFVFLLGLPKIDFLRTLFRHFVSFSELNGILISYICFILVFVNPNSTCNFNSYRIKKNCSRNNSCITLNPTRNHHDFYSTWRNGYLDVPSVGRVKRRTDFPFLFSTFATTSSCRKIWRA